MSSLPRWNFAGRCAVVTGGSRGIGLCIAQRLREAGAEVHIFDLAPNDHTDHFAGFYETDIGNADSVKASANQLPDKVHLLVNNAGITRDRSLAKMGDEDWLDVIDVNLSGAFYVMRSLYPRLCNSKSGRIVNIASINGLRGKFGQANYCAAKAGLLGLTKTAAREFGPKGITVNAIAPGMVLTEMAVQLPEAIREKALAESVMNRLATTDDIAHAVMFLASDAAGMITGEVLRVDAGQYI